MLREKEVLRRAADYRASLLSKVSLARGGSALAAPAITMVVWFTGRKQESLSWKRQSSTGRAFSVQVKVLLLVWTSATVWLSVRC